MTDNEPALAPDDARQRARDAALARGLAELEALPLHAFHFAMRWLPGVERLGRVGVDGDAAGLAGRFVRELGEMLDEQWKLYANSDPSKVVDRTAKGSGV